MHTLTNKTHGTNLPELHGAQTNCFLQCDDVSRAFDLPLDGAFSSTSESWVPVVDAEPFSLQVT